MKYLYTLALCAFVLSLQAQEFPYFLYHDTEPYLEFDDGLSATFQPWDDPNSALPIGFDFTFFDNTIDTWFLTDDFTGGGLSTAPTETGEFSVFMPYGSDIIDIGYPEEEISIISFKTTGTEPNRVFHMQWADCGFYDEVTGQGTANNQVNFQVRLYEGTNDMEIHFGPHSIKNNELAHQGAPGPLVVFLPNFSPATYDYGTIWILGGPTTDPVVTAYTAEDLYPYQDLNVLEGNPSNSTVYRMTTTPQSVDEASQVNLPKVYPNPAQNELNIYSAASVLDQRYEVMNLAGQRVLQGQLDRGKQTLDISALEAGVYMLKTTISDTVSTIRFVKE